MVDDYWGGPRAFKYCDMWSSDSSFAQTVEDACNIDVKGCKMYTVVKKMQNVKSKLKSLHSRRYSNLDGRVDAAQTRLRNAQQELSNHPFHESSIEEEKEAKLDFNHLQSSNLTLIAQMAKCIWVKKTDTNSKYFYTLVKERQNRTKISSISSATGQIITNPKDVEAEFVHYYTQLLGAETIVENFDASPISNGRILDGNEATNLCRPFTVEDVKKALFSIPNSKPPGPDGFSAGKLWGMMFLLLYWIFSHLGRF